MRQKYLVQATHKQKDKNQSVKKRLTFREWLDEERAKLSKMSFGKAVKYIWQYYSLYIIGIIGAVWFIVYMIHRLIVGAPEYWLYAAFANSTASAGNNSQIWKDFAAYSGYDLSEKKIEFSTNMYFDYTPGRIKGTEYYNSFVALTDTVTLDIITMDPKQLVPLGQSGRLMNWNFEECTALREKYADRLLWYTPSEGEEIEEPFPVGIDISDSLLVTKYKVYPQHAALGIGVNSTRLDAVKVFLDFIFVSE